MSLPHEIAELEEARLALAISELADEHLAVAGGFACHGGSTESWMNLVVGVGMHGAVTDDDVDRTLAFYDARHTDPRVEVCPFADLSLARGFGARGFRLDEFETVLWRPLEDPARPSLPTLPAGVAFELVDPTDGAQADAFVDAHVACFAPDGGPKAASMAVGARRMILHPRTTAWFVRVDGELAGAGAIETLGELGTLIGAGILPPFRRRGIQRALIDHRCAVAREAGCTLATISSDPESATGRNALRAGFVTAYTKAILARPAP